MLLNIPNSLTMLRILLIPVFVGVFYLPTSAIPAHWVNVSATLVFALAALTDWLDGFLARRWHVESAFGKIADPLADRLMIGIAVILEWHAGRLPSPGWFPSQGRR